ncbi:centrosomal protein of 55 kDa [Colossoma macropomum]|uniref:centrosomal protein of 55 kDa n=1 Tax=Colossoma macropomum TaxID=42526 RepID=UPI001865088E|nr:centrosomal protein of 55 kDa [Colossoma macropomum]XP_036428063.1 centrosomal protein of 55 kDa [Colossoma macropomum]
MASKGAKETIAHKLGFKNSGSKSMEAELEKVKKENAQLKKTLDEMSKRNGKHPLTRRDSDKAKLLERIVSLETLRETNAQQLLAKEQEIAILRQQLRTESGEVVASLQDQLELKKKEAEQKDKVFQALLQETEELKNKLVTVTQRSQALQKSSTELQVSSSEITMVQEQLRDALEKNQHWLVYDQQREAYVQGILARTAELEQQLNQAKQALKQPHKEANSEDQSLPTARQDQEQVLQVVRRELQEERERASQLQAKLKELKAQCEDRSREVARAQEERRSVQQMLSDERKLAAERTARLQNEVNAADARLEDERKRAAELLLQVNLLQKSVLKQHDEQQRITLLEQQIQISAKDFENEKLDRQSLQHQLHKVLKELRKARDQITRLEFTKQQREARFSEPSSYNRLDAQDQILTAMSPTKTYSALDESFLECPKCRASYPTSQHRELLMHLDCCFN